MLSDCRDILYKRHYAAGQQIPELLSKNMKTLDPLFSFVYRWAINAQKKVNVFLLNQAAMSEVNRNNTISQLYTVSLGLFGFVNS